eukprot:s126_g30.t1
MGIAIEEIDAFELAGIDTFAKFAFCSQYQPGSTDEQPLVRFIEETIGFAPGPDKMSNYRRLFFESHALCLQDLRQKVERTDSCETKVLPLAEKVERINQLKQKLPGLLITQQLEPSAMQRRALAYDMAGVASFLVLEKWANLLFERLQQEPPGGHKYVTHDQILRADKALWLKVAEQTRAKVQSNGTDKAVDEAIEKWSLHAEVQYHMMPLPFAASSTSKPSGAQPATTTKPVVKDNDLKQGNKGKGKGKSGKGKIVVPENCEIKYGDNQRPICMKYNIGHFKMSQAAHHPTGHHVKQSPPLVPEFERVVDFDHVPTEAGYRCLTSQYTGDNTEMGDNAKEETEHTTKKPKKLHRVGVQKSPEEFLHHAKLVEHPLSPSVVLPDVLKLAIFDNLTMSPMDLARSRMQAVVMIKEMAKDLTQEEQKVKRQCPSHVREVLESKRIALWEALLKASNFADMEIVDMVKKGAPRTGEQTPSMLFPQDWKPATTSDEELLDSALWRRKVLQATANLENMQEEEQALHDSTLEEVRLGHLQGPFTEQQLDQKFGKDAWLFNKRFALQQGTPENPKVRVIDDCRRSGLNAAYTTTNKLELLDVDVLACAMVSIAGAHETGTIDLTMANGEKLVGAVNTDARQMDWLGRTLDLSKAYKQVPLDAKSQSLCVGTKAIDFAPEFAALGVFLLGQFDAVSRIPGGMASARLEKLCNLTESILTALPPRKFLAKAITEPVLIFTDGAWEDGKATAGMVLYDPQKDETIVREIEVPQELVSLWLREVGQQIICQVEFFAYLAARYEYRHMTTNRSVIAWIDNESARFAASKGPLLLWLAWPSTSRYPHHRLHGSRE